MSLDIYSGDLDTLSVLLYFRFYFPTSFFRFFAGEALLSVGMLAPSGFPEPELSVKKVSNNNYTISYKVTEIGDHTLYVKWGDEDIPGSPFTLSTWNVSDWHVPLSFPNPSHNSRHVEHLQWLSDEVLIFGQQVVTEVLSPPFIFLQPFPW